MTELIERLENCMEISKGVSDPTVTLTVKFVEAIRDALLGLRAAGEEQCAYCKQWFPKPVGLHHTQKECATAPPASAPEAVCNIAVVRYSGSGKSSVICSTPAEAHAAVSTFFAEPATAHGERQEVADKLREAKCCPAGAGIDNGLCLQEVHWGKRCAQDCNAADDCLPLNHSPLAPEPAKESK